MEENLRLVFPAKRIFHPKKGWRNWWEDMCRMLPMCGIKQHWKREINEELNNKLKMGGDDDQKPA